VSLLGSLADQKVHHSKISVNPKNSILGLSSYVEHNLSGFPLQSDAIILFHATIINSNQKESAADTYTGISASPINFESVKFLNASDHLSLKKNINQKSGETTIKTHIYTHLTNKAISKATINMKYTNTNIISTIPFTLISNTLLTHFNISSEKSFQLESICIIEYV